MARQPDVQYVQFYTDGSAARKVTPIAPLKPAKLPKARKQKRLVLRVDPVSAAGILMAAVMLVLMVVGAVRLHGVRNDTAQMSRYVEVLREENRSLRATYESGYDLAEVEKTALALGLVPREQVDTVVMQVTPVEEAATPGLWERVTMFLTGLFA